MTDGLLGGLFRQARLGWRLLHDSRVPGWIKLVPFAAFAYFLSPIDLIPDWVLPGLGEVDDIVVLVLALKAFLDLSPPGVVREHMNDLFGPKGSGYYNDEPATTGSTIDAPYRIIEPDTE
jgi:uncharacterized membrane protein YkvA (DUF1232 family)